MAHSSTAHLAFQDRSPRVSAGQEAVPREGAKSQVRIETLISRGPWIRAGGSAGPGTGPDPASAEPTDGVHGRRAGDRPVPQLVLTEASSRRATSAAMAASWSHCGRES